MEQYISKSVLLAEIDRRISILQKNPFENHKTICHLDSLKQSLDTLKVKEVDLEKEIERVRKTHYINDDFEKATLEGRQITNIAKHFFKLGLKAQKGE